MLAGTQKAAQRVVVCTGTSSRQQRAARAVGWRVRARTKGGWAIQWRDGTVNQGRTCGQRQLAEAGRPSRQCAPCAAFLCQLTKLGLQLARLQLNLIAQLLHQHPLLQACRYREEGGGGVG